MRIKTDNSIGSGKQPEMTGETVVRQKDSEIARDGAMKEENTEASGFTLIELLVVIAIIGLLMSILLPSLNKAKELARSVSCKAHMKGAATAMSVYATSWNDWLAGPNTSGLELTMTNNAPEEGTSSSPVQNMDWVSPTLGDEFSLPANRFKRLERILNTDLRCPSNHKKYDAFYPSGNEWLSNIPPDSIRYSSYSAALGFHVYSSFVTNYQYGYINDIRIKNAVSIPRSYRPKLSKIGRPTEKIYVMDGARYVNSENTVTFNAFAKQIDGGNFMLYGPALPNSGDPFLMNRNGTPQDYNLRFGWRHDGKFNVTFFDGHVETLSWEESLKTNYYFPKGSMINNARSTQDPDDTEGPIH